MVLDGSCDWLDTAEELEIFVPLKGSSLSTVDVYASRVYIKVNYQPYLLNVDLYDAVDDTSGISVVENGVLKLRFRKLQPKQWPQLECLEKSKSSQAAKAFLRQRRLESMNDKQQRCEQEEALLKERRIKDEKRSTQMQMRVDEMERQHLEDLKAEEKRQAEESVYQAFRELNEQQKEQQKGQQSLKENEPHAENNESQERLEKEDSSGVKGILKKGKSFSDNKERRVCFSDAPPSTHVLPTTEIPVQEQNPVSEQSNHVNDNSIFTEEDLVENHAPPDSIGKGYNIKNQAASHQESERQIQPTQTKVEERKEESEANGDDELENVLPPPRSAARVQLSFTPRVFPTPMRESKKEEEEDWLLRNRRHLKGKAKQRLDAIDISEKDPFWLKGKGDDFFKSGNFEGALNAYACALELDSRMVACLSNRAACWLKLNKYEKCIEDCVSALAILKEEREEELELAQKEGFAEIPKELKRTKEMRKKLHVRKGTALNMLEKYTPALIEYQLALELDPENADLKADCTRLNCLVQSVAQKDLGDSAFQSGDYDLALKHYTKALEFNPEYVAALSNRSACFLKLGDTERMIDDCRQAIALLPSLVEDISSSKESSSQFLKESEGEVDNRKGKHHELRAKLLARLGKGLLQANKLQDALDVFRQLLELDATNLSVAKQIKRIELALDSK